MGLFKNEVGRPSNETIKKRNIFKGLCVLLIIVIICLITYILSDKGFINLDNKKQNSNNEVKTTTKKVIKEEVVENAVDSEKIMTETFGSGYSRLGQSVGQDNYVINYNDNKIKTLAIISSSNYGRNSDICDYFECKKYDDLDDLYLIDEGNIPYYKEIEVFELKDIEIDFKAKFKTGSLTKNELSGVCEKYLYKDNKYFNLYIGTCGAGDIASYPINQIYRNYKKGNELFIEMVTSPLKYDSEKNSMYAVAKDKSKIYFELNDYKDFDKLVKEHGEELTSYTLKFEIEDGKYIFVEQDNIIEFQ